MAPLLAVAKEENGKQYVDRPIKRLMLTQVQYELGFLISRHFRQSRETGNYIFFPGIPGNSREI